MGAIQWTQPNPTPAPPPKVKQRVCWCPIHWQLIFTSRCQCLIPPSAIHQLLDRIYCPAQTGFFSVSVLCQRWPSASSIDLRCIFIGCLTSFYRLAPIAFYVTHGTRTYTTQHRLPGYPSIGGNVKASSSSY
jgi:hypothetical protein